MREDDRFSPTYSLTEALSRGFEILQLPPENPRNWIAAITLITDNYKIPKNTQFPATQWGASREDFHLVGSDLKMIGFLNFRQVFDLGAHHYVALWNNKGEEKDIKGNHQPMQLRLMKQEGMTSRQLAEFSFTSVARYSFEEGKLLLPYQWDSERMYGRVDTCQIDMTSRVFIPPLSNVLR